MNKKTSTAQTEEKEFAKAPEGFDQSQLYDVYRVAIQFTGRCFGGMPKNPDLIKGWIAARTGYEDETTEVQTKEALEMMTEQVAEKTWIGFPSDERGLFLQARQIKALFKECATMLRITTEKLGSKQIFQHGFEIKDIETGGDRIYFGVDKPHGTEERPIHVTTAQGPRTALKRADYIDAGKVSFDIWVLKTSSREKRHVGENEIRLMLTFGQENGLGADRSQGNGKFRVVAFEKVR